uniref:Major facilitator superfamily (MFS) profile domain-containing protein n=1 Tax=Cyclophora tenuis TaxID=216820 RepID=A0A7S1GNG9_CYCTE|mmetsp:Transcript_3593/g.6119  ORF Transcript_3593/g.6119 Transcript_3593/m.6119 type:complete len:163 (+) Transcript_3593:914-1402(+)
MGGRSLYNMHPKYPSLLAGSAAIFGCFPFWYLLNNVDASTPVLRIGIVAIVSGLGSGVTGPIVKATLQNVTAPTTRGQAFALFNTFDDFGRGLGPVFVAAMIKRLGGRTAAFNIGVLGWVFCGMFNLLAFFTAKSDEDRVQAMIAATLDAEEVAEGQRMVVV